MNIVLCTFNLCLLSRGKQLICEQLYLNRKLAGSKPMGTHLFKLGTKNTRTTSMDLSQADAKVMKVGVQFWDAGPYNIFLEDIGKREKNGVWGMFLRNSKILCLPKLPSFEDRILPSICRLVPFKCLYWWIWTVIWPSGEMLKRLRQEDSAFFCIPVSVQLLDKTLFTKWTSSSSKDNGWQTVSLKLCSFWNT